MKSAKINDFFSYYPKLTRDEVIFNNTFINTINLNKKFESTMQNITKACKEFLVSNINLYFSNYELLKQNSFSNCVGLEEIIIICEFNCKEIILLTIHQSLIRQIIASLLMEKYNYEISPLSETEKGILTYYIVKLLLLSKIENIKIIDVLSKKKYEFNHNKAYIKSTINIDIEQEKYSIELFFPKNIIENSSVNKNNLKNIINITDQFIFILKKIKISQYTLQKINSGDIFIFDNPNFYIKNKIISGNICAVWKDFTYTVALAVKDNYYCATFISTGFDMIEELTENNNELNTEDINLDLTIELGKVPISLKKLELLQNGSIIELYKDIQDTLDITINKQKIGTCIPIQIEGKLGIKIISIFNNTNKSS